MLDFILCAAVNWTHFQAHTKIKREQTYIQTPRTTYKSHRLIFQQHGQHIHIFRQQGQHKTQTDLCPDNRLETKNMDLLFDNRDNMQQKFSKQ